jgi:hypothetical protein
MSVSTPTGSTVVPSRVTFAPVSDAVISEIMSYVSLGLPEMGVAPDAIPSLIFKWHTWLSRMNKWMKENDYIQILERPPVKVSANLYFLSNIPPNDYSSQAANAMTASLGPLLPVEQNTFGRSLQRGIAMRNTTNSKGSNDYVAFLTVVNRLAIHAVQTKSHVTRNSEVPLIEPSVTKSAPKQNIRNGNRKGLPVWIWIVVLLLACVYVFVSRSPTRSHSTPPSSSSPSSPSFILGPMVGGGTSLPEQIQRTFDPVISISDFSLPKE